MKNFQGTKGEWKQRKLFDEPIEVVTETRQWLSSSIDIHDETGRIICEVKYKTDTEKNGWGENETIEKWEANARLIAASPELLEACIDMATNPRRNVDKIIEAIEKATK